ncbi:hypothetical protein N7478_011374 [Penicillium angulare]|uniref:uncharacterized protein n=1 Tax=Penicillium angulare TaxID=116970 RepID=UPI002541B664|nr:uncharacterized protein N7478_011374 [Penicillium angulare]KAJ5263769.1 hypothetical protein N7478_011374 [Penicillium angulare]
MSTQSPHPPTPKGSRNNNTRRPVNKKNTTPYGSKTVLLNTPPSSPPRNMSPAGVATDSSNANNVYSKKKQQQQQQPQQQPPRSGKKPKDTMNRASPATNGHNGLNGHRYTSSQSNGTPQPKDSAYAGPTFHASPAPSALPIPSFFSKSLPESDLAPTIETDSDTPEDGDLETTPSKPRSRLPQPAANEPKPTPLDFLFKAAVQARQSNNPMGSPESTSRVCSPQTDSKALHSNPPGGLFPFDMDSSEQTRASSIGPSFAPSYQDRMKALRPTNSGPAQSSETEEQRRMKTEQLKHLLLNPPAQRPASASVSPPQESQHPANYGARARGHPNIPHYATPMRTNSGPAAMVSRAYSPAQYQQVPNMPTVPNNPGRPSYPYTNGHHNVNGRNLESPLRREMPYTHSNGPSPGPYGNAYMGHVSAPNVAPPPNNYVSPQPQYATAAFKMPTNSPSPSKSIDTKKMEDDLRRILKLDATPGIQSSFA